MNASVLKYQPVPSHWSLWERDQALISLLLMTGTEKIAGATLPTQSQAASRFAEIFNHNFAWLLLI